MRAALEIAWNRDVFSFVFPLENYGFDDVVGRFLNHYKDAVGGHFAS